MRYFQIGETAVCSRFDVRRVLLRTPIKFVKTEIPNDSSTVSAISVIRPNTGVIALSALRIFLTPRESMGSSHKFHSVRVT